MLFLHLRVIKRFMINKLYEADFYGWTNQQVKLLKSHHLMRINIEHIVEEIDGIGNKNEKKDF